MGTVMNLLILGNSSIVRRRALPALVDSKWIGQVDVASQRNPNADGFPTSWRGDIFDDYAHALAVSSADLVYISLVNSDHEAWVEAALDAGKHVVVDKPAFLSLAAAERFLARAEEQHLCLAEAVVFLDHPRMDWAKGIQAQGEEITRVDATFSFPPLPPENFRYQPNLGGGALFDLGPYAAAVSRLFFHAPPLSLTCRVNSQSPDTGVDTSFSLLASYEGGRSMVGHFGFDTEYQNRISAFGPRGAFTYDRVFTPPDIETSISLRKSNKSTTEAFAPANCFGLFFDRLCASIEAKDWCDFTDALKQDAAFIDGLIRSVKGDT